MKNTKIQVWDTLDKLVLISSVLVNGDQNWSFVSGQMHAFYEQEQGSKSKPDFSTAVSSSKLFKMHIVINSVFFNKLSNAQKSMDFCRRHMVTQSNLINHFNS